jgi:DNA polymerase III subunit delta
VSHYELFAVRKIIRIRTEKALDASLGEAILAYLNHPSSDHCVILNSGRPTGSTKWAKSLTDVCPTLTLWPPSPQEFPQDIQRRAKPLGLSFSQIQLQRIATAYEGNLAGLHQCLHQMAQAAPSPRPGALRTLDDEVIEAHLSAFAQFSPFDLAPAILSGQISRARQILDYFETHEPQELIPILSILAKEFRTVHQCQREAKTQPLSSIFKSRHIWPKLQPAYSHAITQLSPETLYQFIKQLSECDDLAKGLSKGNPWNVLSAAVVLMWNEHRKSV